MAVTVITTTGNTYEVANGAGWEEEVAATGELAVTVYGPEPSADRLAAFGSVEVIYQNSEVTVITPAAAPRGGL